VDGVTRHYFSGLKFGMLLQLAVGPMCLMVFHTAQNSGLLTALSLVAAVALVDAFYILLASLGVSRLLNHTAYKRLFSAVGAAVLILFGANIALSVFGIQLIPGLAVRTTSSSIFIQGLIMTLSNPLTIIFWGSVFTTKILEDHLEKRELFIFSTGLVSATIFFLTAVALLGTAVSGFLPDGVSNALNLIVGVVIIGFGLKLLFKR